MCEIHDDLDPRVKIELEKMNVAMEEINRLEVQIQDAKFTFQRLLTTSTDHLKNLSKSITASIERSRPYFVALDEAKRSKTKCSEAAAEFRRLNEMYMAAKETENLAEKQFQMNQHEWKFDSAWQEMLNNAIIKVQNAESQKTKSAREHQEKAEIARKADLYAKQLEKRERKHIEKSHKYFEEKKRYDELLNYEKERVTMMQKLLHHIKESYANSLKNLERISNEIHAMRQRKQQQQQQQQQTDEEKTPKGVREPGVGAEICSEPDREPDDDRLAQLDDRVRELVLEKEAVLASDFEQTGHNELKVPGNSFG